MQGATLSPLGLLAVVGGYFAVLIAIGYLTAGRGDDAAFFRAGRSSPWYLVAWGMIGASLSGVTFVSIPGVVGAGGLNQQLSYMQVVLGYLLGYLAIAGVLLPLYYRLGLTSIYGYLEGRFGPVSYLTGAAFFQLSRIIGASFRLYLVAIVMDAFITGPLGIPFAATVAVTLALIYAYTFKGGIQTVVYTDTLQTAAMLVAVCVTVFYLAEHFDTGIAGIPALIGGSGLDRAFFFDTGWDDPNSFWKQFFGGALITVVMTGLDQDMMQKNLTCRSLGDARKNMASLAILLIPINLLFLCLGILLYLYIGDIGLDVARADQVFPTVALQQLPPVAGIAFLIGLIAAAYSSADSALTALTTSFCVDFLGFERDAAAQGAGVQGAGAQKVGAQGAVMRDAGVRDAGSRLSPKPRTEAKRKRLRGLVHVGFAVVLFLVILLFYFINDDSVINSLFKVAALTYGPLLGLFAFGMVTRWAVRDAWVPVVCVAAALLTYVIDANSAAWLGGFQFGFLTYALNGALTFLGLVLLRR